jgi:hypothetical protein
MYPPRDAPDNGRHDKPLEILGSLCDADAWRGLHTVIELA